MSKKSTPFVVGLTGGIGSGKSAATDAFAELGVPVIDADVVARHVVEPGTSAFQKITEHFGNQVITADGTLDRAALREKVFTDPAEKTWLNNLLHPAIRQQMRRDTEAVDYPYCILSVPLLIENNLTTMTDRVLVVDCPESLQISRACARDKQSNEATIKRIMQAQASRETRLAAADDIIDNSGTLASLKEQVNTLHARYLTIAQGH
ncbi:dephospho-CoA kinase [Salinimonas profundi]|uniref:dephospho-CoA kinase n=1 Tax=Salinimonas profundi TaxID=2729140 RepID=UPI001CC27F3B|nr:dephospho-CoA kinase [Salinimonas profundi]